MTTVVTHISTNVGPFAIIVSATTVFTSGIVASHVYTNAATSAIDVTSATIFT